MFFIPLIPFYMLIPFWRVVNWYSMIQNVEPSEDSLPIIFDAICTIKPQLLNCCELWIIIVYFILFQVRFCFLLPCQDRLSSRPIEQTCKFTQRGQRFFEVAFEFWGPCNLTRYIYSKQAILAFCANRKKTSANTVQ